MFRGTVVCPFLLHYHIISYNTTLCCVSAYHIMPYHGASCYVMSHHIMAYLLIYNKVLTHSRVGVWGYNNGVMNISLCVFSAFLLSIHSGVKLWVMTYTCGQ